MQYRCALALIRRTTLKKRTSDSTRNSMTRRELLRNAGKASVTLAAAQALAPFWLAGCSSGPSGGGGGGGIKVGIMHSLSGFLKVSEESLKDAELMAIQEINSAR